MPVQARVGDGFMPVLQLFRMLASNISEQMLSTGLSRWLPSGEFDATIATAQKALHPNRNSMRPRLRQLESKQKYVSVVMHKPASMSTAESSG
jgi:hypothetical protein